MVLGVVGSETAMDFGSKEVEPRLMRGVGCCPWIAHALFLGGLLVGPKMSMCYLHKICLK